MKNRSRVGGSVLPGSEKKNIRAPSVTSDSVKTPFFRSSGWRMRTETRRKIL